MLTRELLERHMEAIKNAPPHPCRLGQHVISATALREGWDRARCGNCGAVITLHR